ncbi:MAG TPA: S8 family serine peptidase [Blastocatellia bacterium]
MSRLIVILTLAAMVAGACLSQTRTIGASSSHAAGARHSGRTLARAAAGQVIVKLRAGESSRPAFAADRVGRVLSAVEESGAPSVPSEVKPLVEADLGGKLSAIIARRGLDRVFVLKFDPSADTDSIITKLEASGRVEYAEPNYLVSVGGQTMPPPTNDPLVLQQWAISNPGFNVDGYGATKGDDIAATAAWQITMGSPNVVVAVVDTGVDVTHPDLATNIYTSAGPPPTTGFNVADNNSDVTDVLGHGTQMAGIIAAITNNSIGIAGTCQCKILPVRFFTQTGPDGTEIEGSVADAAKGILYAIQAGADIINASWDTMAGSGTPAHQMRALEDACIAANDADVLMVCIAGNDGFDNDDVAVYPGHYELPNQIVVAASDYNDQIWRTVTEVESGYGPQTVQLAAPGVFILSTQARGTCPLCTASQNPADWYTSLEGTSASAAFVSGVAALVKSQYPRANVQMMRARILQGVDQKPGLEGYVTTGGRLNAYNALTLQLPVIPPILTQIQYKAGKQELILDGTEFQQGAVAIIAGTSYTTTPMGNGVLRVSANVPASAFPVGVSVPVMIQNPDGGTSQPLNLTR